MIQSEKRICFVSNKGWLLFAKNDQPQIGGAEVQEFVLATKLANRGWRVVILCERMQNISLQNYLGVRLMPLIYVSEREKGLFRILRTCITFLVGIKRSKCSIIYQRNPNRYSGLIGIFCKLLGKKFIVAGAHDRSFRKNRIHHLLPFPHWLSFKLGLKIADTIIAQNKRQKKLIRKNFGRNAVVLYNTLSRTEFTQNRKHVLWVAGLMEWKRPELFIELARENPEYDFVMIGSPRNIPDYLDKLRGSATDLENIKIYGHQPFEKADAFFFNAKLFVNTSVEEGFPNTFLQAWRRGVPVLSFVDPDDLISTKKLGSVARSYSEMCTMLRGILSCEDYDKNSISIYETFNSELSDKKAISTFESLIQNY